MASEWGHSMSKALEGRVAFVTGAAQGQGAAIARLFVTEGARVVLADVLDAPGRELASELGSSARFVHLDVGSPAAWDAAVQIALEINFKLDVLVNNAGIIHRGSIEDTSLDEYLRVIHVNQVGCWLGMRTVAPHMRANGGGVIVNTSSLAGLTATAGLAAYTASKYAIRGMTRVAALEFGPSNIRVNSIYPGAIRTSMVDEVALAAVTARQPIARIGLPEEIAKLMLFLCSDASSFCTGAEFTIDGGYSAGART